VPEAGAYRKVLDTDAARYGGSDFNRQERVTSLPEPCQGHPCHLKVDLPPLGALFFEIER
jgi:1,4-alpha-glucan branching enzyme